MATDETVPEEPVRQERMPLSVVQQRNAAQQQPRAANRRMRVRNKTRPRGRVEHVQDRIVKSRILHLTAQSCATIVRRLDWKNTGSQDASAES